MDETLAEFLIKLGFKVDDSSASKATETVTKLKSTLTKALGVIGITLSITKVAEFVSDSIEAASTAEQMQQKFDAVFTGMEDSADEWAESFADSIGRSKNDIKTYMADIQNLLVGMGMEREAGAELTEEMIEAAINIASFNNIDDETAVNAMSKALLGQSESAKTLGAVLNDNTLATAMQTLGLEGEFSALDEVTKMQVRYQAIVNQSADAMREENGVVGDAALSMDSYESKVRSFNAVLEDIKINLGTYLLPIANKLVTWGTEVMSKVRDFTENLDDMTDTTNFLNDALEMLQTFLSNLWNKLSAVAGIISGAINSVGGLENAVKLLALAFGAIKAYEILSGIPSFISQITENVGKLNLKLLAIVAIIVAIILIIDDIRAFMNGDNSMIGSLIEQNGGDADALRETIQTAFDNISSSIDNIKQAFEDMAPSLEQAWSVIGPILETLAEVSFAALIGTIVGLSNAISPLIDLFTDLITLIADFFTGDWSSLAEDLGNIWEDLVNTVTGFVDGLFETLNEMLGLDLPTDMKTWAGDAIDNFISGLTGFAEKVSGALSSGVQWISDHLGHSTPKEGPLAGDDEWGSDFVKNFETGIEEEEGGLQTAVNSAAEILSGIKDGFTEGVSGLISSITGNSIDVDEDEAVSIAAEGSDTTILQEILTDILTRVDTSTETLASMASGITKLTASGNALVTAMSGTVTPNVDDIANTYYYVTQNISYSNTFNGDTRTNQTTAASKMKDAATDTTTYLANALAFGR